MSDRDVTLPLSIPGLVFICRTCYHMARVWQKGCEVCDMPQCGGPTHGSAYPCYHGVLSEEAKQNLCFVCGAIARQEIVVDGQGVLGVCSDCVSDDAKKKLIFP